MLDRIMCCVKKLFSLKIKLKFEGNVTKHMRVKHVFLLYVGQVM